jgi:hypothetical protein
MSEQMRKEFEAWAKAKGVAIDFGGFRINEYNNIFAQMYWEGWQASRAAIVVELPQELKFPNVTKKLVYVMQIKQAIAKAGVRYK